MSIVAPDPRVWLLHKQWLSERPEREPAKRRRDAEQAALTWRLVEQHLPQFPLDEPFFAGLPRMLREMALRVRPGTGRGPEDEDDDAAGGAWSPRAPGW